MVILSEEGDLDQYPSLGYRIVIPMVFLVEKMMSQSIEFMQALKKLLKLKGVIYQDLALALDLSLPSVKRLFSSGDISLTRIDRICEAFDIEFSDLLKLMELSKSNKVTELTLAQEEYLSDNPHSMAYLELLFLGYSPKKIQEDYGLTLNQTHKNLKALDKCELIEWLPHDKVKIKVNDMIRLRPDSKISIILREKGVKSFLNHEFKGELCYNEFMTFKASKESVKKFNVKLRTLFQEIAEEGIMEAQAGIEVDSIALFTGVRPWRLVEVLGLK